MRLPIRLFILWLILGVLFSTPVAALAPCRTIVSQNALHFGWNDPTAIATKFGYYQTMLNSISNAGPGFVAMLQEVMDPQYLPFQGYRYQVSARKGRSTYLESYGFVDGSNANAGQVSGIFEFSPFLPQVASGFDRPPSAVMLVCDPTDPDANFWLINNHTRFGKGGKTPRRQEVALMAQVIAFFLNCSVANTLNPPCTGNQNDIQATNIVIAGDWNLTETDLDGEFANNVPAGYQYAILIDDNDKTSLNRQRGVWSKNYDHFVLVWPSGTPQPFRATRIDFSLYGIRNCNLNQGCLDFVINVSDHIGIQSR